MYTESVTTVAAYDAAKKLITESNKNDSVSKNTNVQIMSTRRCQRVDPRAAPSSSVGAH